jgi:hypothetical protein
VLRGGGAALGRLAALATVVFAIYLTAVLARGKPWDDEDRRAIAPGTAGD